MKSNQLTIQLSECKSHFVSLEKDIVINESSVSFKDDSTSIKSEILNKHFLLNDYLNQDFDEVTLSWSNKKSTLVPNSIFSETKPNEIFNLCFGKKSIKYDLDYNRIYQLNLVNIYEIPSWIKHFFIMKFPKIIIQHEGSHIIRQNVFENILDIKVNLIIHNKYFQLIIIKNNTLEFYSSFEYQDHQDIIYHLMFTLQQKQMMNKNGTLNLIDSSCNSENKIIENFKKDINKIKQLNKLKVNMPNYYIAKSQILCV